MSVLFLLIYNISEDKIFILTVWRGMKERRNRGVLVKIINRDTGVHAYGSPSYFFFQSHNVYSEIKNKPLLFFLLQR